SGPPHAPARTRRAMRASLNHTTRQRSRNPPAQGLDPSSSIRSPRFHLRRPCASQTLFISTQLARCYNVTSSRCGDQPPGRGGLAMAPEWLFWGAPPSLGRLQFASPARCVARSRRTSTPPMLYVGIVHLIAAMQQVIPGSTLRTSKVEQALRCHCSPTRYSPCEEGRGRGS